jgi:hypothetical protein
MSELIVGRHQGNRLSRPVTSHLSYRLGWQKDRLTELSIHGKSSVIGWDIVDGSGECPHAMSDGSAEPKRLCEQDVQVNRIHIP